ncbi:hypothetical protein MNV49_000926 [Pseudohyphozyma bogoriensis]|nr:hypothetical protein MNV49_000926 [Pseudohyphozyma bogoriensis]
MNSTLASVVDASHNPYVVKPWGLFFGILASSILYGIHLTQLHIFFFSPAPATEPEKPWTRLFVCWVFLLSSVQQGLNMAVGAHYFVQGIDNKRVWGTFAVPLSFQDALVPLMALSAQMFYAKRIWGFYDKSRWILILFGVIAPLNFLLGVSMAISSYFWAHDPYSLDWVTRTMRIERVAKYLPAGWLGMSAILDGTITLLLMIKLAKTTSAFESTKAVIRGAMRLTMETVFLTHLVGGVMAILFLSTRTRLDAFWVLLEVITELYALSILFTIKRKSSATKTFRSGSLAPGMGFGIDLGVTEEDEEEDRQARRELGC